MKIHIEDKLYLESDGIQYIIREYTGNHDKDGKETFRSLGFYGNINHAINSLVKNKIMQSTATTLSELKVDIEKIKQDINSKINA